MEPIEFARHLRRTSTTYEQLLWHLLRNRKLVGAKCRRQHPLGKYVADFYCPVAELVVEIDGQHHWTAEGIQHDAIRDRWMRSQGIRVLRFTGKEVEFEADLELAAIRQALFVPHPQPLSPKPLRRGEGS